VEIADVSKLRIHLSSRCSIDWGVGGRGVSFYKKQPNKKKLPTKSPDVSVLSLVRVMTGR